MAYDETVAERVRRALAGRRGVVEKKMMGGLCFMVSGNMCCGVTGSAVLIRVGREGYREALAKPHVRPLEFAGRRASGFVLVDPDGHRGDKALAAWIERGLAVVAALPRKTAAKKQTVKKQRRT
jgi:hypothetical protein